MTARYTNIVTVKEFCHWLNDLAAMTRLNRIQRCNTISFASKFKLYMPLVTSILLYSRETWTLLADSEKKNADFRTQMPEETTLLSPTWSTRPMTGRGTRSTSLWVHRNLCLATVKSQKLPWFGHLTCHESLSKTNLQDSFEGGQCHGQHRKCWMDNIKEWTSVPKKELLTRASCIKDWKKISSPPHPHPPQTTKLIKRLNLIEIK